MATSGVTPARASTARLRERTAALVSQPARQPQPTRAREADFYAATAELLPSPESAAIWPILAARYDVRGLPSVARDREVPLVRLRVARPTLD